MMMYSTSDQLIEKYRVWFNSPHDDVSGDKWLDNSTRYYTLREIADSSRHHTITHLIVEDEILPNLPSFFPQLTHLGMKKFKIDANFLNR